LPERVHRLFEVPYNGRAKLWIVYRLLGLRARHAELFERGDYVPLTASGARARHVLAFARRRGRHGLVAVAGRLFASLGTAPGSVPLGEQVWEDTALDPRIVPAGTLVTDVLTGEAFGNDAKRWPMSRLFAHFPGAVLAW
jgi:(1->4)-alpha-D-glucan 1-alpha-D-glucosylmutase